jgi:transcriptional regulator GlxA family with amidase domain
MGSSIMQPVARKTAFVGIKPRRHIVAVLAFDGVVLGDLATPCEVFGRAGGRYEIRLCSESPRIRSEHVELRVPWRLSALRRADTVIVPGIDHLDRRIPDAVLRAIRHAALRGARVASICTGAFVLAATGVLDGLRATTHWMGAAELARRHPRVTVDADVLYVDNGRILTSAGAAAGLDLCLHLVRRDLGADAAADVARAAVMPLERAGGQAQFIRHEAPAPEGISFAALLEWMERNLGRDLSLATIARQARTSTRTLSRRFREQVGGTPAAWIARARVRKAQRLLEKTDHSIERIAGEVGFGSSTVLRDRFSRVVGMTPQAYRRSWPNYHVIASGATRAAAITFTTKKTEANDDPIPGSHADHRRLPRARATRA